MFLNGGVNVNEEKENKDDKIKFSSVFKYLKYTYKYAK